MARGPRLLKLSAKEWLPGPDIWVGLVLSTIFINILSLVFPLALLQVYDRIIPSGGTQTLVYLILAVIGAMLIEMLLKLARNFVSTWGDARLTYKSSTRAFEHLLHTQLNEYEKAGPGVHLERINSLNRVKDFYGGQALTTLIDLPFILLFVAVLGYIHPYMMLVPMFMVCLSGITARYTAREIYGSIKQQSSTLEKKINFIIETLSGIHTIKSLGMENVMLRRYERLQNNATFEDYEYGKNSAAIVRISQVMSQLTILLVVIIGALQVLGQEMTPGAVAACILLSTRCVQPMIKAMHLWARFQLVKNTEENNERILSLPRIDTGTVSSDIKEGKIEFKDVCFCDNKEDRPLLDKTNFTIEHGDIIHLDGPSSSAKTALLLLIKGINQPQQGQVLIQDTPVVSYDPTLLGERVTYMAQNGVLFQGSILENMTLFRNQQLGAKAKDLAEKLNLDSVIEQMPQGYDTKIGKGAIDLVSKGIAQRITLLRCLIHDPSIILFDEANSAIDMKADDHIRRLFESYQGKKTIILVTNRPSLQRIATRRIVLTESTIVERPLT